MKELSFNLLKDGLTYNVLLEDQVIGRMTLLSPSYRLVDNKFIPGRLASLINKSNKVIETKKFKIDPVAHRFFLDGKEVYLTMVEFKLFYLLASRENKTFNREELNALMWEKIPRSNILDVHAKNLRKKIGTLIETVRGIGYRLNTA